MSQNKKHIDLLRKLAEGNISDNERWQLEKASLDDPFLAEAIEGYYENEGTYQFSDLQQKLSNPSVKKTNYWRPLSIAASLLFLLVSGLWIVMGEDLGKDTLGTYSAEAVKGLSDEPIDETLDEPIVQPTVEPLMEYQLETIAETQKTSESEMRSAENVVFEEDEKSQWSDEKAKAPDNNNTPPSPQINKAKNKVLKPVGKAYSADKSATGFGNTSGKDKVIENRAINERKGNYELDNSNEGRVVEDVVLEEREEEAAISLNEDSDQMAYKSRKKKEASPPQIDGYIYTIDGLPLAGAKVISQNNAIPVLSDQDGAFSIKLSSDDEELNISSLGFKTVTVKAKPQLSVKLEKAESILSDPPKRLVDMMTKAELEEHYSKNLDAFFNQQFNLCHNSPDAFNKTIRIQFRVTETGEAQGVQIIDQLDLDCKQEIKYQIEQAAHQNLFDGNQIINMLYKLELK